MITLYGYSFEIYQALLLVYLFGYGSVLGVRNTYIRFLSLLGGGQFTQNSLGKLLDATWYSCAFVLIGTLV